MSSSPVSQATQEELSRQFAKFLKENAEAWRNLREVTESLLDGLEGYASEGFDPERFWKVGMIVLAKQALQRTNPKLPPSAKALRESK